MVIDWPTEIVRIVYWKQIIADNDDLNALPWHLPRAAASAESISSAEQVAGIAFSEQYKSFLSFADGWRGFCVVTDLFGTIDFIGGKSRLVRESPELLDYLEAKNIGGADVAVIGASDLDVDIFIHISEKSKILPGGVIWFAGEEVDRYECFFDFFTAMVNYNARVAKKFLEERPLF